MKSRKNYNKGFTLIETIVGVFVFALVSLGIHQAFIVLLESARNSRLKALASSIAAEQIEIIRNIPYISVGTLNGIPSGVLSQDQTIVRNAGKFDVKTTIRNIDDPFDGILGGTPNDTAPADYKLAQIDITCMNCDMPLSVSLNTFVAPKSLEGVSSNGALFVNVFDSLGQPVANANINVVNTVINPQINITDVSGNVGTLQLVDAPPSNQNYQVIVTKDGYSTDKTYTIGLPENPNPTKPHATIAQGVVTQISFSIDRTSNLNIYSKTDTCTSTPAIPFTLTGAKIIGNNPTVKKYSQSLVTDSSGVKTVNGLEWDTYSVAVSTTSGNYYLSGSLQQLPMTLLPNVTQDLTLVVREKSQSGLLVTVKDLGSSLPVTGAQVTLEKDGNSKVLTTGRGSLTQDDWSQGSGQSDFINASKYFSGTNVEVNVSAGEIVLEEVLGDYQSPGTLESSSFDTGSASNFYNLKWNPTDQPVQTGQNSVKFQIATNNDNSTWNFVGPDGTSGTYYTVSNSSISPAHNNDRYFRYKAYLSTESTISTPNISDVSFSFTSSCVPSGQVFFDGLSSGTYVLKVEKDGYASSTNNSLSIDQSWQESSINLSPL